MKVALIFLAVAVAVTYAQMNLVDHEVQAIIKANAGITSDDCTMKCDNVFVLVDTHDEEVNDRECAWLCKCHIDKVCGRPMQTTTAAMV